MLHKAERRTATTKTVRETEAEAIAFVVSQTVGLDAGRASADDIHLYHGNTALLAKSLEVIQRTSALILSAIETPAATAEHLAANDENNEQSSEEILLSTIDGLPDDKLTGFTLRLVFTGHTAIPRESEIGFLTEAKAAFTLPQPKKTASKKAMTPTSIKAAHRKLRSAAQSQGDCTSMAGI